MIGACWEWSGARLVTGYGRLYGRMAGTDARRTWRYVHRIAYALAVGPIPVGALICHHCDNPPCFNPAHLYAGSFQSNVDDTFASGRRARAAVPRRLPDEERLAIRRRLASVNLCGLDSKSYATRKRNGFRKGRCLCRICGGIGHMAKTCSSR